MLLLPAAIAVGPVASATVRAVSPAGLICLAFIKLFFFPTQLNTPPPLFFSSSRVRSLPSSPSPSPLPSFAHIFHAAYWIGTPTQAFHECDLNHNGTLSFSEVSMPYSARNPRNLLRPATFSFAHIRIAFPPPPLLLAVATAACTGCCAVWLPLSRKLPLIYPSFPLVGLFECFCACAHACLCSCVCLACLSAVLSVSLSILLLLPLLLPLLLILSPLQLPLLLILSPLSLPLLLLILLPLLFTPLLLLYCCRCCYRCCY